MSYRKSHGLLSISVAGLAVLAACGAPDAEHPATQAANRAAGTVVTVTDTTIEATLDAAGVAGPIAQSTLSTKLMGTVTAVLVREGDRVAQGQPLVRIDARDLAAKQSQVSAGIAEAEAVHRDAVTQAARIRALHADSAATRAQLDAAETGLARAEAAVRQARAGAAELDVIAGYSVVRSPFAGVVTQRFVDPGAFAAPGAPLVTVQDGRRLRVTVSVAPEAARGLQRGAQLTATVEGRETTATVEGVVPAPAGNVYTVNAVVDNAHGRLLAGSAATLRLPQGERQAVLIPSAAVRREGDLTGVLVRGASADELRWVRLGATQGDRTEVLGGLHAGDQIVVPAITMPQPDVAADSRRG
ncbi:MAG TPA: efflux RND transporter periplasmic adaptor subunit [Gemmatimonadales bacterium]